MNRILACLALCFWATAFLHAQKVTLTLTTEKTEVIAGKPVVIDVVMTNNSDVQLNCDYYYKNALDFNFQYKVLYEDGQPTPQVTRKHPDPTNTDPCILAPGATSAASGGVISAHYDFSRPGKYTIQASRRVTIHGVDETVKSNIITVTVLSPPDPSASQK